MLFQLEKKNLDIWNPGDKNREKQHLMNFKAFFSLY